MPKSNSQAQPPLERELQAALPPIASLISKSEKAQQKVAPGTWQHTILRDNLHALRLAHSLMTRQPATVCPSPEDWQTARHVLAGMIGRVEQTEGKFPAGKPQHTLQRNRLKALRLAVELIEAEMGRPRSI